MEWWNIVAIILLSNRIIGGLYNTNPDYCVKIADILGRIINVIIWLIILYYGGFWK